MLARALALTMLFGGSAAAAEPAWTFEVTAVDAARELRVEARFAAGYAEELSVDDGAEPFVRDVEVRDGASWRPVAARGDSWFVPACPRGCQVRYRFELGRAAEHLDGDAAQRYGAVIQAPPSTWLLHPLHPPPGRDYAFSVRGGGFASGARRMGRERWGGDVTTLMSSPYAAFGPLTVETLPLPDAAVEVAFVPSPRAPSRPRVMRVLARAAEVVRRYYRRFPVPHLLVLVVAGGGDELHGRTVGGSGGASLLLSVPAALDEAALMASWVPAHELVHLGFPTLPRQQLWMAEGLATYLEPIARARAGDLTAAKVWRDLVDGLPQGQPEPADRGLDRTPTWGRIYWGGALWCLVADLQIRERTGNRRSLDDAMRAIVAAGGNLAAAWPLERALRVGDAATGTDVLTALYRAWARAPVAVDLAATWARLGVHPTSDGLRFDEAAPLAALRRSITAP